MIGFIDSGFGGLSVIQEMFHQNVITSFVYFGDNAHNPYGTKTKEELLYLSKQLIDYLMKHYEIQTLVIACNTICAAVYDELVSDYPTLTFYNILAFGSLGALLSLRDCVGVLATQATVDSKSYQMKIKKIAPDAKVYAYATQEFVSFVENDYLDETILIGYLLQLSKEIDTLILGCTHFPFLLEAIQEIVGQEVYLFNPAVACVNEIKESEPLDFLENFIFLTTGDKNKMQKFLVNKMIVPYKYRNNIEVNQIEMKKEGSTDEKKCVACDD